MALSSSLQTPPPPPLTTSVFIPSKQNPTDPTKITTQNQKPTTTQIRFPPKTPKSVLPRFQKPTNSPKKTQETHYTLLCFLCFLFHP
ncbi:hypothetical protein Sjap_005492 [Stephania japonica]|uniref:Uncharacterized protein n=1 Tax=Stephania japonica TaxID=461633 RepID=A0AAP0K5L6_9MAGN